MGVSDVVTSMSNLIGTNLVRCPQVVTTYEKWTPVFKPTSTYPDV